MPLRTVRVRVLVAALLAFCVHSAVLAPLVGRDGWSRAVSVGLDTLVADHAAALAVAAGATVVVLVAARGLVRVPIAGVLAALAGCELVAALCAVAAIGELTLVHVPVVVAATSGLGLVFVATATGLIAGRQLDRRP